MQGAKKIQSMVAAASDEEIALLEAFNKIDPLVPTPVYSQLSECMRPEYERVDMA